MTEDMEKVKAGSATGKDKIDANAKTAGEKSLDEISDHTKDMNDKQMEEYFESLPADEKAKMMKDMEKAGIVTDKFKIDANAKAAAGGKDGEERKYQDEVGDVQPDKFYDLIKNYKHGCFVTFYNPAEPQHEKILAMEKAAQHLQMKGMGM